MGLNRNVVAYAIACVAITFATFPSEADDTSITGTPRASADGHFLVVISPDSIQGIVNLRHIGTKSILERIQIRFANSRAPVQAAGFHYKPRETTVCRVHEVHDVETDKLRLENRPEIAVMQEPCAESADSLAIAVARFKELQKIQDQPDRPWFSTLFLFALPSTSLPIRLSADGAWQYVVEPGDTGGAIARQLNGKASLWPVIYRHNETYGTTAHPDLIFAGHSLEIPPNLMSAYLMRGIPTMPYFTTDPNQSLEQIASQHQYSATSLAVLNTLNTPMDSLPNDSLSEEHQFTVPAEVSMWQTVRIQSSDATAESIRIYGTDHFRVMLATLCSHALKGARGNCVVPTLRLAQESTLLNYLQQREITRSSSGQSRRPSSLP